MRPRTAWLLLAALALPAGPAQARRKKPAPEPAVEEPAVHVPTLEERQAVFGEIDAAFKRGEKTRVADLLVEVIDNPDHAVFHAEAYARLGAMLAELDLPYAALVAYERALSIDAEAVSSVAPKAIELADKVGDTALLEHVFATNVGLDVDPATRSRMAYLAAREAHHDGNYGTALAILKMVRKDDPFYPEALSLQGVVLSMQGRHEQALAPLQDAMKAGHAAGRDARFFDVVNLNLARAYYAAGNYPRAIEHYAEVRRESPYWLEAEFERAWAHFRLSDMNGVLGLTHDHAGPFFEDEYFPEGRLLRVYALFLMCKFPEASKEIDRFRELYTPKQATLDALARRSPQDLFEQMALAVEPPGENAPASELPEWFTFRFRHDDRFADSLNAVHHADDELGRLAHVRSHPFSEKAARWVEERKAEIIRQEGRRIADRVAAMKAQLDGMLGDIEMAKLDMMQFETRLYERASVTGKAPEARRMVTRKFRVKPNQRWWPWEGEYWADEVGYYRVTAKPECPLGLTPSAGQGE